MNLFFFLLVLAWQDSDRAAATVSSDDLEKAYTVGNSAKLNFKAGVHEYELDFGGMFCFVYYFLFLSLSLSSRSLIVLNYVNTEFAFHNFDLQLYVESSCQSSHNSRKSC